MRILSYVIFLIGAYGQILPTTAQEKTQVLKIYLDADRSRLRESAFSIEKGIKTAFSEIGYHIQNHRVEFVPLDHRGNATRSKLNMDKAFADPDTLLVLAGLHSPPLIKNREYINDNNMLTLVPWAAGGPVTRAKTENNWVFRLSIDDTKAGIRIANYAIGHGDCKKPHLLLEKTPWGESNRKTMTSAIEASLGKPPPLTWYNWGASLENGRIKLRSIMDEGSDCLLYVGNAIDGETFMRAMLSLDTTKRLPIYSHWGITGGNLAQSLGPELLSQINLTFIQTCFSFVSSPPTEFSRKIFSRAQALYPEIRETKDLKAPAGFIHAYDLGRIVIQALSQFTLGEDMVKNRGQLKEALENLQSPVRGLIRQYEKPFEPYTTANDDAHEALGLNDFCMANFGSQGQISVLPIGESM